MMNNHHEQQSNLNNITMETAAIQDDKSHEPNGPILDGKGYIPAQTIRKAYYDFDETPQTKAVCLRSFRQLIDENQEENNFDEHTDAFLLKYLRHRKFDVDDAYKLLDDYYTNRESTPDIFRNLTRKNVKKTLEQGIVGVMPQRDAKGRVIVLFNFSAWNMSIAFHFAKLLRVWVYTLEKLFESDETQINGIVIVCNLHQLSVLQTKSLRTHMLTKAISVFQGKFPFRISRVHLINPSWHFKLCWKMTNVSTLLKPKLYEKIHIHEGDLTNFYEDIPKKYLPVDLGGSSQYDNHLWINELLEPEQNEENTKLQTSAHIQLLSSKQQNKYNYPF